MEFERKSTYNERYGRACDCQSGTNPRGNGANAGTEFRAGCGSAQHHEFPLRTGQEQTFKPFVPGCRCEEVRSSKQVPESR
jgi:hypothetical protein